MSFAGQAGADTVRTIRLMTREDLELSAAYYPAVSTNTAAAVLLLHSLGQTKSEWDTVPVLFQRNGIAVLTFDLRGHGESNRRLTANGVETVDYRKFGPQDYKDMLLDINQAYDWLASQPGIDKHRIAIIGSSLGSNLALRYAAYNDEVAALILLSPTLFFQGLRTDDVITGFGKRPLRIAVSRDDALAYESAKYLIELRQRAGQAVESNELVTCSGQLRGAAMLTGVKELSGVVFSWLEQVLSVPPVNEPVASPKGVESDHHR